MEALYPYTVVNVASGPLHFVQEPPSEHEILEDANRIHKGISSALSVERLITICRFVRSVIAEDPLYVNKKNLGQSIVIIPTQQGKTVFVSLHKTISNDGSQSFVFKDVSMLSFDHAGRLSQGAKAICNILKLVTCFTEKNPQLVYAKKRISIMQRMHNYSCFPTNYSYVVTESKKMGEKLSVFQERASHDLFNFYTKVMPISQFPLDVKFSLCKTIVCALRALHSNQFIYRDLKFENILVFEENLPTGERTWRFKVTDLGLTCSMDDSDARAKNSGTIHWVAPDQFFKGSIAIPENDLWSLGLVIHFLFNNNMPPHMEALARDNGAAWITWKKEIINLPPPPQRISELQDLIPALLQEDPKNRLTLDKVHEFLEGATSSSWCNIL